MNLEACAVFRTSSCAGRISAHDGLTGRLGDHKVGLVVRPVVVVSVNVARAAIEALLEILDANLYRESGM